MYHVYQVLLFIASKLHFFSFSSHFGSSTESKPCCLRLKSACVVNSLCHNRRSRKVLNSNCSWKTIQLRLHATLKTGAFLSFLKGTVTWQGARILVLQFCFPVQNQRKLLTFLASISMQLLWWWIAGAKWCFFSCMLLHYFHLFIYFTKRYDFCCHRQQTIKKATFYICWLLVEQMLYGGLAHVIYIKPT